MSKADKGEKTKRPPRQVWLIVVREDSAPARSAFPTKKAAIAACWENETVVGPYVLAERIVNK